jgi:hypothetical protein
LASILSEPKLFRKDLLEGGLLVRAHKHALKAQSGQQVRLEHGEILLARGGLDILADAGHVVVHGLVHVHAKGQMDAALEIQAEINGGIGQKLAQSRASDARHRWQHKNHSHEHHRKGDKETPAQIAVHVLSHLLHDRRLAH